MFGWVGEMSPLQTGPKAQSVMDIPLPGETDPGRLPTEKKTFLVKGAIDGLKRVKSSKRLDSSMALLPFRRHRRRLGCMVTYAPASSACRINTTLQTATVKSDVVCSSESPWDPSSSASGWGRALACAPDVRRNAAPQVCTGETGFPPRVRH
jgi:hypothetical protein